MTFGKIGHQKSFGLQKVPTPSSIYTHPRWLRSSADVLTKWRPQNKEPYHTKTRRVRVFECYLLQPEMTVKYCKGRRLLTKSGSHYPQSAPIQDGSEQNAGQMPDVQMEASKHTIHYTIPYQNEDGFSVEVQWWYTKLYHVPYIIKWWPQNKTGYTVEMQWYTVKYRIGVSVSYQVTKWQP